MSPEPSRKSSDPSVVVALLNWNNADETIGALASLGGVVYENFDVLIVDNGSTDDSVARLKEEVHRITAFQTNFVLNTENKGFAGGCNTALQWAFQNKREYILLLNNDTEVDKHFLTLLVRAAEEHKDGAVFSPSVYFYDNRSLLWFGGPTHISFLRMDRAAQCGGFQKKVPQNAPITPLSFATGCAMLCKVDVLEKVEGFDERFFLYYEDVDVSLRIRKAGGNLYWVPESSVYHKVSQTTFSRLGRPIVHYYDVRNALLFSKKHCPLWGVVYRAIWSCFTVAKQVIKIGIRRNRMVSTAILMAILDYYRGKFGQCEHRNLIISK